MNQIIEKHVSTWADGKTLPASYVVPSGKRRGDNVVPTVPNIPVIDLSKSQSSHRKETVQQIIEAAQHFGFFQAGKHCDPNLITILLQEDVPGLQFVNNGEWRSVEPIPYAFVVNIGLQLQIISNGKLRSMEHRVVTNAVKSRTTSAYFIEPRKECFIEPAKAVLSAENPSNYKGVLYKELVKITSAAFIE